MSIWYSFWSGQLVDSFDKRLLLVLAFIGFLFAVCKLLTPLLGIYQHLIRPEKDLKKRYGDGWVLVTGSTDGIGKGYAEEFARRGFKIIIVGRNKEKAESVAAEIQKKYNVQTKVVLFNFNNPYDAEKYHKAFVDDIEGLDIAILVNNVGIGKNDKLYRMKDSDVIDQIYTNIIPQSIITKYLIQNMLLRPTKSAVISVSSAGTEILMPEFAVYNATKSYNYAFSQSMIQEHPNKIDILTVLSGAVKSNSNKNNFTGMVTPNEHANGVIRSLGYQNKSYGPLSQALSAAIVRNPFVLSLIRYFMFNKSEDVVPKTQVTGQKRNID